MGIPYGPECERVNKVKKEAADAENIRINKEAEKQRITAQRDANWIGSRPRPKQPDGL